MSPAGFTERAKRAWNALLERSLVLGVFVRSLQSFFRHEALGMAAALAFYTALSLAPLVAIVLWVLSLMNAGGEEQLVAQVEDLIGTSGGEVVRTVIDSAEDEPGFRGRAGVLSLVTLAFAASGVFAHLQSSLNEIWSVEVKPGLGFASWIRRRLLSFAMLGAIAFLMLVSLVASTAVGLIARWTDEGLLLQIATLATSVAVYALLFAVVFTLLPDVRLTWRDAALGSLVTAVLFAAGKSLIGLYLSHSSLASSYGAAGSLVIVLAWVYFSSAILLFGAELTQEWATARGRKLTPRAHAVRREPEDEIQPGSALT